MCVCVHAHARVCWKKTIHNVTSWYHLPCYGPTCFYTLLHALKKYLSPSHCSALSYSRFSLVRSRNPLELAQRQEDCPLRDWPFFPASLHLFDTVFCRLSSLAPQLHVPPMNSACTLLCLDTVPAPASILYHFSAQLPTAG